MQKTFKLHKRLLRTSMGALATLVIFSSLAGLEPTVATAETATPTPMPTSITMAQYKTDLTAGLKTKLLPKNLNPSLDKAAAPNFLYGTGCHAHMTQTVFPSDCTFGDVNGSSEIWLVGDSHAAQWFYALDAIAKEQHAKLIVHTKSSCEFATGVVVNAKVHGPYNQCKIQNDWWLSAIAEAKPNLVLVGAYYGLAAAQLAGLNNQLANLSRIAKNVVMLGDTPSQNGLAVDCLRAHLTNIQGCTVSISRARPEVGAAIKEAAGKRGIAYFDAAKYLCLNGQCPSTVRNIMLYRDATHITSQAAMYLKDRLWMDLEPIWQRAN